MLVEHCRYPTEELKAFTSMSREDTIAAIERFADFDIDADDAFVMAREVVASFEGIRRDRSAHHRAVRFLSACVKRYVWTWKSLGCESDAPSNCVGAVQHWLDSGEFIEGFADLCLPVTPIRDGEPVEDCDEPALSDLSSASSRLAYFCVTRSTTDAAAILVNLFWADAEGLQPQDGESFFDWLASTSVAIAWPEENGV